VLGIEHGFEAPDFAVLTEQDILGDRMVRARGRTRRSQNFLSEASALATGDLVTHIEHGVGRYLGLKTPDLDGLIDWVLELRRQIGIPHTLAGLKVGPERFDELAAMAAVDPTVSSNPVKVGPRELKGLYENALAGML